MSRERFGCHKAFLYNIQYLGNGSTDSSKIWTSGEPYVVIYMLWIVLWKRGANELFGLAQHLFCITYNISESVQPIAAKFDRVF